MPIVCFTQELCNIKAGMQARIVMEGREKEREQGRNEGKINYGKKR